jgi:hypothetical protein
VSQTISLSHLTYGRLQAAGRGQDALIVGHPADMVEGRRRSLAEHRSGDVGPGQLPMARPG